MFFAFVRGSFADGTRTFKGGIRLPPVFIGVYGEENVREFSLRSLTVVWSQVRILLKPLLFFLKCFGGFLVGRSRYLRLNLQF